MSRARPRRKRWAASVGERGVNRVRVFEHPNGRMYLEWREGGRAMSAALGTTDRVDARRLAEAKAASLNTPESKHISLGQLFDAFLANVARRGYTNLRQRRRTFDMMSRFWGRDRGVRTLSMHDVSAFTQARYAGTLRPPNGKGGVGPRAVEEELQALRAALRWATITGDGSGGYLLDQNPIRGFALPRQSNPQRPRLANGEYEALLSRAAEVDERFRVLLVLAFETGHRLSSIRQLEWTEIDLDTRTIFWEGRKQKNGMDHRTPLSDAACEALRRFRANSGRLGGWLLANRSGLRPVGREQCYKWWKEARELAGLPPNPRGAFHMFRRELASHLATAPLAVVKNLLGSKNPQVLVAVYQDPTVEQQRSVLDGRRRFAIGE